MRVLPSILDVSAHIDVSFVGVSAGAAQVESSHDLRFVLVVHLPSVVLAVGRKNSFLVECGISCVESRSVSCGADCWLQMVRPRLKPAEKPVARWTRVSVLAFFVISSLFNFVCVTCSHCFFCV